VPDVIPGGRGDVCDQEQPLARVRGAAELDEQRVHRGDRDAPAGVVLVAAPGVVKGLLRNA
jgi:hypothetical protein